MQTVQTCNFGGTVTPQVGMPVTVHCVTCGLLVFEGAGAVNVGELRHECRDTTSAMKEFALVFGRAEDEAIDA